MPEETNQPETLRDRGLNLWAQIDAAKEELAEYDRLSSIVGGVSAAMNAHAKLARTIRAMQGPTVSDLLGRIAVLETIAASARPDPDAVTAELLRSRAVIDDLQRENNELRVENSDLEQAARHLPPGLDHPMPYQQVCPDRYNLPYPPSWDHAPRIEDERAAQAELIGHFRAVLHHLSAPQPVTRAQAQANATEHLANNINALAAGGSPLGA